MSPPGRWCAELPRRPAHRAGRAGHRPAGRGEVSMSRSDPRAARRARAAGARRTRRRWPAAAAAAPLLRRRRWRWPRSAVSVARSATATSSSSRSAAGAESAFLVLIVIAVLIFYVLPRLMLWWRGPGRPARTRRLARSPAASGGCELAAAEAAEDDPASPPTRSSPPPAQLFLEVQAAWDADDRVASADWWRRNCSREWERRLDDFERRGWRNRVEPLEHAAGRLRGAATRRATTQWTASWCGSSARLRDYMSRTLGQRDPRAVTPHRDEPRSASTGARQA